ncbi:MAG: NAD-dependent epimerase/dehydratase family protein [Vicinamibacterales bacterium]
MNVLVTGGAGYVGSMVVSGLLGAGRRVRVLDSLAHGGRGLLGHWSHPDFTFLKGDVRDAEAVRRALEGVDAVVHLAAIVGDPACARQPELATAVNLEASQALLAASEAAGVGRFVFASTCSNYGKMKDPDALVDETSELLPVSLYARTKVAVEERILAWDGPMCATSLRLATVFGVSPRMRFDLTVNEFTMELLTKGRLVVFGRQFWRPYVHVRDVARAILTVLEAPEDRVRRRVFNVGSTAENYTKEMLLALMREHAPDAEVEYVHKDEDPRDYRVSFERIASELGFTITRTVPEGIREVADLVRFGVITDADSPAYRN